MPLLSRFDKLYQPFDTEGLQRHIREALALDAGGSRQLDHLYHLVRALFAPVLLNTDRIPPQPCLFVGNHAAFALDAAVLIPTLRHEQGRFVRSMADNWLWSGGLPDRWLLQMGAVLAHPRVCDALMENGLDLLVYPGGAREAIKPNEQKYQLLWQERYGFVRLAARHGYTIQPFAMVGPEEFYDHRIEGAELLDTPPARLLRRLGLLNDNIRKDLLPPIPAGLFGSLLPKPQRCYIRFGEAVDLSRYRNTDISPKRLRHIHQGVANQIDTMLDELQDLRDANRYRENTWRTWLSM